jgi:hypothetical protein
VLLTTLKYLRTSAGYFHIRASRGITGNLRTAISSKEATQEFIVVAAAIKEWIPYGYQG